MNQKVSFYFHRLFLKAPYQFNNFKSFCARENLLSGWFARVKAIFHSILTRLSPWFGGALGNFVSNKQQ